MPSKVIRGKEGTGCSRGCDPCVGTSCPRFGIEKKAPSDAAGERDIIQETVDAVSGATWTTRNMIMEDLFHQDLETHAEDMPAYRPPGT